MPFNILFIMDAVMTPVCVSCARDCCVHNLQRTSYHDYLHCCVRHFRFHWQRRGNPRPSPFASREQPARFHSLPNGRLVHSGACSCTRTLQHSDAHFLDAFFCDVLYMTPCLPHLPTCVLPLRTVHILLPVDLAWHGLATRAAFVGAISAYIMRARNAAALAAR